MVFGHSEEKESSGKDNSNTDDSNPVSHDPAPRYSFTAECEIRGQDTKDPDSTLTNPTPKVSQNPVPSTSISAPCSSPASSPLPPSYAAHARVTSQPRPSQPSESDYRAGFLWQKTPNLPTDPPPAGPHQYSAEEVAEMERKGISPQLKWELDAHKRESNGKGKKRSSFWTKVGMMDRIR